MSRARDVADGALGTIAGTAGQVLTSDGNNWSSQPVATDLVNDTSPQLGGDLDMNSNAISSGVLPVKNTGTASELRLYCESNNAHYVGLKSPAHSAFAGNHTITMPPNTGTSGQFLSTDGNGVTSWAAAGGGSMNLIQSVTLSDGDATATVTGMNSTYDRYIILGSQVRIQGDASSNASQIRIKREVGGAYAMNANYSQFNFQSNTSTIGVGNQNNTGQTFVYMGTSLDDGGNRANSYSTFEFIVDRPSDTVLNKLYSWNLRHVSSGDPYVKQVTGTIYDQTTSAVTGIRFYPNVGSFKGGAIRLYGISNSQDKQ